MKSLIKYSFLLALIISLNACEKEFINVTEIEIEDEEVTIPLVNTTVRGVVRTKGTMPLPNAVVELKVSDVSFGSALTNSAGEFILENVPANIEQSLLFVNQPDYAISYKNLNIKEDLIQFAEVILDEKSTTNFSKDENILFEDSNIKFELDNDNFREQNINSIILDVNTLDESELNTNQYLPKVGLDESNHNIYLDHQFAFQINLFNENNIALSLTDLNEYEIELKSSNYEPGSTVWYFDTKESIWKTDEAVYFKDANTIVLSRSGLISIATSKEKYLFTGEIMNNNEIQPFAKLTIRDSDNNNINEVYTNSIGEYIIDLPTDISGEIVITIDNNIVEIIPFTDIQNSQFSLITINTSNSCIDVVLSTLPFSCESNLTAEMLVDIDASLYTNFSLTIDNVESETISSDTEFSNINWLSLLNDTLPYSLTYLDENSNARECEATISLINEIGIIAVCIDKITVEFKNEESILIFADDVDSGSIDSSCGKDIQIQIARPDECNMDCDSTNFQNSITLTRNDIGKTIHFLLMATNESGFSSQCFGEIIIAN